MPDGSTYRRVVGTYVSFDVIALPSRVLICIAGRSDTHVCWSCPDDRRDVPVIVMTAARVRQKELRRSINYALMG